MVGAVSSHGARIWVRISGEYPVAFEFGADPELRTSATTQPIVARRASDFTVVVTLAGLEPSTEYYYRVKVNGVDDRYLEKFPPFRLKTAPADGAAASFRVAFGSCPRFADDRVQPIWPVVTRLEPDLFFWIGDNIYGDTTYPEILREEYRRQRDVAGLQPLLRNVPHLAIWDDHDYGQNNQDRRNPIKKESLAIFREYWANPAYGLPDVPGIFFSYSYGAVDFFFLDDRFYRDPDEAPDSPEKTLLGPRQLAWLMSELKASTAAFKVLVSGSGWSVEKGMGSDSWASFLHERDRLFDFIRDNDVAGVVLLSGDTHIGEVNVIPWSERGGYDMYDLVSSPLAQETPDSWLERRPERRVRPVYFQGSNVGLIDFTLQGAPRLTYRLFDVQGRSIWEPFELHASELANGVRSWPEKVDGNELERQKNYDAGRGYYEKTP
jgi:alkaline phosphatase D